MKKNYRLLAAGLCTMMLIAGCGSKGPDAETTTAPSETTGSQTETTAGETETYKKPSLSDDYSAHVTLGEYKGITVTAPVVTDEDLETRLAQMFRDTVENGDTVNIDFEGLKDGVAFEGGTASGQSLTIGSGSFIEGFEEGLVGAKVGETVNLDLTFPDPYTNNPDLAGQDVVFVVTVNSINGVSAAELTEEYVTANTEFANIEEYRASVRETLQQEKNNEKLSSVWASVKENATINSYPEEEVKSYASEMNSYYLQMAAGNGLDLATLLSFYGMSEEDFATDCQTYGEQVMEEYMILSEIAKVEGITVSDEDYRAELDEAIQTSGQTEEALLEYYGGEEALRETFLFNKVLEFLAEQAVEE